MPEVAHALKHRLFEYLHGEDCLFERLKECDELQQQLLVNVCDLHQLLDSQHHHKLLISTRDVAQTLQQEISSRHVLLLDRLIQLFLKTSLLDMRGERLAMIDQIEQIWSKFIMHIEWSGFLAVDLLHCLGKHSRDNCCDDVINAGGPIIIALYTILCVHVGSSIADDGHTSSINDRKLFKYIRDPDQDYASSVTGEERTTRQDAMIQNEITIDEMARDRHKRGLIDIVGPDVGRTRHLNACLDVLEYLN